MAKTLHEMIAANPIAAATARYLHALPEYVGEAQAAHTELVAVLTNQVAVDSDELAWLKWFYTNVDLGPGGDDYRADLANMFEAETGMTLPPEIREAI